MSRNYRVRNCAANYRFILICVGLIPIEFTRVA
jgi:hypothetical protein